MFRAIPFILSLLTLSSSPKNPTTCAPSLSNQPILSAPATASVVLKGRIWIISPIPGSAGIRVISHDGDKIETFSTDMDGRLGKVRRVVASAESTYGLVALGIEYTTDSDNRVRYRVLYGETWELGQLTAEDNWVCSPVLSTRKPDERFTTFSIGFIGGDSLAFNLQTITRDSPNGNRVETHTFVHHCPIIWRVIKSESEHDPLRKTAIFHYISITDQHEQNQSPKAEHPIPVKDSKKGSDDPSKPR